MPSNINNIYDAAKAYLDLRQMVDSIEKEEACNKISQLSHDLREETFALKTQRGGFIENQTPYNQKLTALVKGFFQINLSVDSTRTFSGEKDKIRPLSERKEEIRNDYYVKIADQLAQEILSEEKQKHAEADKPEPKRN